MKPLELYLPCYELYSNFKQEKKIACGVICNVRKGGQKLTFGSGFQPMNSFRDGG